jgi:hypothetical protein
MVRRKSSNCLTKDLNLNLGHRKFLVSGDRVGKGEVRVMAGMKLSEGQI